MQSQVIGAEINGMKVRIVPIVRGDKTRAVRNELGASYGNSITHDLQGGRDFDSYEEFAEAFPQTAAVISEAGIDTSQVYAVMQVQD